MGRREKRKEGTMSNEDEMRLKINELRRCSGGGSHYALFWDMCVLPRIEKDEMGNNKTLWLVGFCWCTFPGGWMDADRMRGKRSVRKVINFQDEPLILSIYRTLLIY